MSQFDLEMELEASPGSISRIENGKVNPTKETLVKITEILKLSDREKSYTYGELKLPAGEEEIEVLRKDMSDYLSTKGVLAYIVDDRYRMIDVSKDFFKFLGVKPELKNSILNQNLFEILLDPRFNIVSTIEPREVQTTFENLIRRFYAEMGFMIYDEQFQKISNLLKSNKLTKNIVEVVSKEKKVIMQDFGKRRVNFKVFGLNFPMYYSDEPILSNRRFELIEYTPTSKIVRFLSKII
jgi:transcriptional regulator with XRE-family HTH domain